MGVIGEGRSAIAEAEEQHAQAFRQERADQVNAIMGNLSATLAEPEFVGDVETALVHYMGQEAFYDDATTGRYTSLARRIEEEAAKDEDSRVPVLFVYRDRDEMGEEGAPSTVFMKVPQGEVRFRSATTVEENVPINAYTGQFVVDDEETKAGHWEPTSANITHRRLSLVGNTVVTRGDIFEAGERVKARDLSIEDGFVFSESHVADGGHGGGLPTSHSFTDFSIDRLEGEPTVLVGWQEIEDDLLPELGGGSAGFGKALGLEKYFAHMSELGSVQAKAPKLAEVLEAAASFQKVA